MMLEANITKRGAIGKPQPKNSFKLQMTDELRKKVFGNSAAWDNMNVWLQQYGSGAVLFDNDWAYFTKEEIALMFDLRWSYND